MSIRMVCYIAVSLELLPLGCIGIRLKRDHNSRETPFERKALALGSGNEFDTLQTLCQQLTKGYHGYYASACNCTWQSRSGLFMEFDGQNESRSRYSCKVADKDPTNWLVPEYVFEGFVFLNELLKIVHDSLQTFLESDSSFDDPGGVGFETEDPEAYESIHTYDKNFDQVAEKFKSLITRNQTPSLHVQKCPPSYLMGRLYVNFNFMATLALKGAHGRAANEIERGLSDLRINANVLKILQLLDAASVLLEGNGGTVSPIYEKFKANVSVLQASVGTNGSNGRQNSSSSRSHARRVVPYPAGNASDMPSKAYGISTFPWIFWGAVAMVLS